MFDGQTYDPEKPVCFPACSLLVSRDSHIQIYIDAANPSRTICSRKARSYARKMAAGLKAAGLKKGDCVSLHAFNDICYSMAFIGIIAAGGIFGGQW